MERNGTEQKGTEEFPLEGTYDDRLVRLPAHSRADPKLKPVIKHIVQMPLFKALTGMGHRPPL